jgi:hypothetical protein
MTFGHHYRLKLHSRNVRPALDSWSGVKSGFPRNSSINRQLPRSDGPEGFREGRLRWSSIECLKMKTSAIYGVVSQD